MSELDQFLDQFLPRLSEESLDIDTEKLLATLEQIKADMASQLTESPPYTLPNSRAAAHLFEQLTSVATTHHDPEVTLAAANALAQATIAFCHRHHSLPPGYLPEQFLNAWSCILYCAPQDDRIVDIWTNLLRHPALACIPPKHSSRRKGSPLPQRWG